MPEMKKSKKILTLFLLYAVIFLNACVDKPESFEVRIEVNVARTKGEVSHFWRFFGADEPNYAYMTDGRKLLGELGELRSGEVYFRAHNLLTTGAGTHALKWGSTNAYTEDEKGNPVYYWAILDSIFDAYLENGVRPYVEIGFMPEALSINPEPYRHYWNPDLPYDKVYTGWAYPPKDYKKWEELVFQWASHCVERYGKEEVEQWYWETWNEPNIGYWQGTVEEFLMLHDHAINGVLRALPTARAGGPDVAGHGGQYMRQFIEHCLSGTNYATGEKGTKLDFLAFHAKGQPDFDNGTVRMNMAPQLGGIDKGFRLIASYPQISGIPVIIGECDPEGCAACQGDRLGYRNGTMYSSYTAATFPRILDLAERHHINLEGVLTWAFEFENQPWFAGFRSLATNGVNKPVMNVFRMFSMMDGQRIEVYSDGEIPLDTIIHESVRVKPDVSAFASYDGKRLFIMIWHYYDCDLPGPDARISLEINNLPVSSGSAGMSCFLVDRRHSNSYTTWLEMGSPREPDPGTYAVLEKSGRLEQTVQNKKVRISDSKAKVELELERQGVAMVVLEFQ